MKTWEQVAFAAGVDGENDESSSFSVVYKQNEVPLFNAIQTKISLVELARTKDKEKHVPARLVAACFGRTGG